jgi:hypothetical protein
VTDNININQNINQINVSEQKNNVIVSSVGTQGAPGNFVYIYDLDGGTPTSIYGGNIIINAGGV